MKIKYSLILPSYNEYGNLKLLLPKILKCFSNDNYQIIVVDDNSEDKTVQKLKTIFKKKKQIKYILRKKNRGLALSIKDGIKTCSGKVVIVMDSDFNHRPEDLKKMILNYERNNLDMLCGSRFLKGGSSNTFLRHFCSLIFNSFINTEGNFMQKLIVGLKNGIGVILNFFVGSLLDFVKDTLAWFIGFFSTDLKKKLNDFSFTDLISDMFDSFDETIMWFGAMMYAVAAGFKGAIKAGMPGGQTPQEGFKQAYDASMAGSADATAAASYFYTPESVSTEKEIDLFTPKSGEKVMTASTDAKESSKSSNVVNGGNSSVVNAPVINNNIIPSPIVNTNPLNLAGAYSSVPLNY